MSELDKERMALFKASRAGDAALSRSQDQNRRLREEGSKLEQSDVAEEHETDATMSETSSRSDKNLTSAQSQARDHETTWFRANTEQGWDNGESPCT